MKTETEMKITEVEQNALVLVKAMIEDMTKVTKLMRDRAVVIMMASQFGEEITKEMKVKEISLIECHSTLATELKTLEYLLETPFGDIIREFEKATGNKL